MGLRYNLHTEEMYVTPIERPALKSFDNCQAAGKTESEAIFERYLNSQNLQWDRVPESTLKQPDYKVAHGLTKCLFEVKEFDDPDTKPTGGFSPDRFIFLLTAPCWHRIPRNEPTTLFRDDFKNRQKTQCSRTARTYAILAGLPLAGFQNVR